jgi:hypothetical protein
LLKYEAFLQVNAEIIRPQNFFYLLSLFLILNAKGKFNLGFLISARLVQLLNEVMNGPDSCRFLLHHIQHVTVITEVARKLFGPLVLI